jgi:hypothetical protein
MVVSHAQPSRVQIWAVALAMVVAGAVSPAAAGPISLTGATGAWTNPVGGSNVTEFDLFGTDVVLWGGLNGFSGYRFTPTGDVSNLAIGSPFALGAFTHVNMPITDDAITAVDYRLSFNLTGVGAPIELLLQFQHDETDNDPSTCFAGSISVCDDIVTTSLPLAPLWMAEAAPFRSFRVLGFSQDGGHTFASQFFSPERGSNTAMLYAQVEPAPIPNPEPATFVLFGTGLAVAVLARHRARRSTTSSRR